MKFKIRKRILESVLEDVSAVASKKNIIPILSHALIVVESGIVTISATDIQTTIREIIEGEGVEISENGKLCLPAGKFLETVKSLTSEYVNLEVKDSKLVLSGGKSVFKFPYLDTEGFPKLPFDVAVDESITIDSKNLRDVLSVKYATDNENTRNTLCSVLLQINGNLKAVATDSRRLALKETEVASKTTGEKKALITKKGADILSKFIEKGSTVVVNFTKNHVIVERGDASVALTILTDPYVNYDAIIPKHSNTLTAKGLKDAIRRVAVMSDNLGKIVLDIKTNQLTLSTSTDMGDSSEEVECAFTGEPMKIAFNKNYLLDALSDEKTIYMGSPIQPIMVKGVNSDIAIIMPAAV